MIPVVAVFIDGLKPESIGHMEFLNSLKKARIRTELGAYSSVCDASIYTGVFPNKHLCWFVWKYSPNTSPFKILNRMGISQLPHNIYSKYLCHKACLWSNNASNPGIFVYPFLVDLPMKHWAYFDTDIKKPWEKPDLYNGYPNLFELFRLNRTEYEVIGTRQKDLPDSSEVVKKYPLTKDKVFVNYFLGDIDHLSHKYGQNSYKTIGRLKLIDKILEEKYKEIKKMIKDFYFIVFSDHGHGEVESIINLEENFKKEGVKLGNYIHFVDSNYARFWFYDSNEETEVRKGLSELEDKGCILTKEDLHKYNINMPDNRYGDLIFYLDKPYVFFSRKISALGRKVSPPVSTHGYLPDYPDSDAVFISNNKLKKDKMHLQDIAPSLLQALDLEIPKYMDGKPIWK